MTVFEIRFSIKNQVIKVKEINDYKLQLLKFVYIYKMNSLLNRWQYQLNLTISNNLYKYPSI